MDRDYDQFSRTALLDVYAAYIKLMEYSVHYACDLDQVATELELIRQAILRRME